MKSVLIIRGIGMVGLLAVSMVATNVNVEPGIERGARAQGATKDVVATCPKIF
jgi:hypothetical protein